VTAKRRRYTIIDNRKKDEWSGFADLLANLIEKYAAVLDIENLPEPPICLDSEKKEIVNNSKHFAESIEKEDIARYNIRVMSVQTYSESDFGVGVT